MQELVDQGELDPAGAASHPWRNRITRAVGIDERLELDALQDKVEPGDRYLLCSDGLTGEIKDEEIAGPARRPRRPKPRPTGCSS